jgi:hypothetical protein
MKKLYLPLLLAISFVSKAQILDSTKVEKAKVYSLKIANPIVNKPCFLKKLKMKETTFKKI